MPFGFVELHGGATRVRIVPELGAKIVSLEALGREWLWMSDDLGRSGHQAPASDAAWVYSGGYDDYFPTKAAGRLAAGVPGFAGLALAEYGELRSERPQLSVETNADGQQAVCIWEGRVMPYRFTRAVHITADGTVIMRYQVVNNGANPLPFVWVGHAVLPMNTTTRLDTRPGLRTRVSATHGDAMRGLASEFRWPSTPLEKRIVDFSSPDQVARRYACQLSLDLASGEGAAAGRPGVAAVEGSARPDATVIAVEEGDARLELAFDQGQIPHLGLWFNKREWTSPHPFPSGKRSKPELNLAIEPRMGSADSLVDALGREAGSDAAQRAAHWLAPAETRSWVLSWRAVRSPIPEAAPRGRS